MKTMLGECLCGAVQFQLEPPTLFCCHCHCRYCRKAHGAATVTWLGSKEARFMLLAGEEALVWYASSEQSRRGFCSRCGTTLFFASSLCPGEIHVARACIDGPVDREPSAHVFYDHRVGWMSFEESLLCVNSSDDGLQKYQSVAPLRSASSGPP